MAFLFRSKKKKEKSESETPPEPPKPTIKSDTENQPKTNTVSENSSQETVSKQQNSEQVKETAINQNNQSKDNKAAGAEGNANDAVDFDLDKELKELESKLIQNIQPKEGMDSPSTGFEDILDVPPEETPKQESNEMISKSSESIIIHSNRENAYFIRDSDLKQLVDEINEILANNSILKNNGEEIEAIELRNKEITQTLLKNCNVMFNKSIGCDAIIRGENNG